MCGKCKKDEPCTCKRANNVIYTKGCADIQDADCVIYKPKGTQSNIATMLGFGTKSKLSDILEGINRLLENLFTVELSEEEKAFTSLSSSSSLNTVVEKLLEIQINADNTKVKVSESDPIEDYLFEKIKCVDCLKKRILEEPDGKQYIEIGIDYDCLKLRII